MLIFGRSKVAIWQISMLRVRFVSFLHQMTRLDTRQMCRLAADIIVISIAKFSEHHTKRHIVEENGNFKSTK